MGPWFESHRVETHQSRRRRWRPGFRFSSKKPRGSTKPNRNASPLRTRHTFCFPRRTGLRFSHRTPKEGSRRGLGRTWRSCQLAVMSRMRRMSKGARRGELFGTRLICRPRENPQKKHSWDRAISNLATAPQRICKPNRKPPRSCTSPGQYNPWRRTPWEAAGTPKDSSRAPSRRCKRWVIALPNPPSCFPTQN